MVMLYIIVWHMNQERINFNTRYLFRHLTQSICLTHSFLHRGGMAYTNTKLYGNTTMGVCHGCDLSISDMINFLSEDREHMKQGIFLDVQHNYLLHSNLSFDEVSH